MSSFRSLAPMDSLTSDLDSIVPTKIPPDRFSEGTESILMIFILCHYHVTAIVLVLAFEILNNVLKLLRGSIVAWAFAMLLRAGGQSMVHDTNRAHRED